MRQEVTFAQALEGTLVLVNDAHPLQAWPGPEELSPQCILPKAFDPRVGPAVAAAVAQAARDTGAARI